MSGEDLGRTDALALRSLFLGPPRWTLAVAESVTCGRLQAAVGGVAGASEFFLGGITAYALGQKIRHLGIDPEEAESCSGVSPAIAAAMAIGACGLFASDFAAATTGFAEPDPGRGFAKPGAFWAIARRSSDRVIVIGEGLFQKEGLGRVSLQEAVAAEVIAELVGCVRRLRTTTEGES